MLIDNVFFGQQSGQALIMGPPKFQQLGALKPQHMQ